MGPPGERGSQEREAPRRERGPKERLLGRRRELLDEDLLSSGRVPRLAPSR